MRIPTPFVAASISVLALAIAVAALAPRAHAQSGQPAKLVGNLRIGDDAGTPIGVVPNAGPGEKVFRLDTAEEAISGWPQVIQHIDFAAIGSRLGYPVMPLVVQLDAEDAHGFTRDWKAIYGITPDKHRAYAMQWFTLALVLVLIYLGVNTKRIRQD